MFRTWAKRLGERKTLRVAHSESRPIFAYMRHPKGLRCVAAQVPNFVQIANRKLQLQLQLQLHQYL